MTAVLSLTERIADLIDCSKTIAVSSPTALPVGTARNALRVVIEQIGRGNAELEVAHALHNTLNVRGLSTRERNAMIEEAADVAEALWNATDDGYPITPEDEALDADLTRYVSLLVPAVGR